MSPPNPIAVVPVPPRVSVVLPVALERNVPIVSEPGDRLLMTAPALLDVVVIVPICSEALCEPVTVRVRLAAPLRMTDPTACAPPLTPLLEPLALTVSSTFTPLLAVRLRV